jgi:hypothetical protein
MNWCRLFSCNCIDVQTGRFMSMDMQMFGPMHCTRSRHLTSVGAFPLKDKHVYTKSLEIRSLMLFFYNATIVILSVMGVNHLFCFHSLDYIFFSGFASTTSTSVCMWCFRTDVYKHAFKQYPKRLWLRSNCWMWQFHQLRALLSFKWICHRHGLGGLL